MLETKTASLSRQWSFNGIIGILRGNEAQVFGPRALIRRLQSNVQVYSHQYHHITQDFDHPYQITNHKMASRASASIVPRISLIPAVSTWAPLFAAYHAYLSLGAASGRVNSKTYLANSTDEASPQLAANRYVYFDLNIIERIRA